MKRALVLLLLAAMLPWPGAVRAQDAGMAVTVELGDVSPTKLPFIVAAESGIYTRNGLTVTQFITPTAADNVRQSGVIVPPEFIKSGIVGDINVGGGSPTIVRMTTIATAPQRIILATNARRRPFTSSRAAGSRRSPGSRGSASVIPVPGRSMG